VLPDHAGRSEFGPGWGNQLKQVGAFTGLLCSRFRRSPVIGKALMRTIRLSDMPVAGETRPHKAPHPKNVGTGMKVPLQWADEAADGRRLRPGAERV
jgi:hypothetical protein